MKPHFPPIFVSLEVLFFSQVFLLGLMWIHAPDGGCHFVNIYQPLRLEYSHRKYTNYNSCSANILVYSKSNCVWIVLPSIE